ncbi:MAG: amidohydrolase [Jatrophihabitans sp.]|uniref:amidohydrolase n=1 Tax=Jatrophihabitans sp. TaxID=1932789 RepID=UPI003F7E13C2
MRDVVALRREIHAHPELAFAEFRTTGLIVDELRGAGLAPIVLPEGSGVVCDIGSGDGPIVALRADIDALPIPDQKQVEYRSTVDGVCHGCGHDAHTAILLAAGRELAAAPPAGGRVRLIFQPGEETIPGGALHVIRAGALGEKDGDGPAAPVQQIFALHCDPRIRSGQVGLRVGAITAACDQVNLRLHGAGGHTARPHLTEDVVYAMGQLITELPGLLSRRVDPRAALSMVWGSAQAGNAPNAIPMTGLMRGTLRVFDRETWAASGDLVRHLVEQIVAPSGVGVDIEYVQGVPPVVNDADAVAVQASAVRGALGDDALVDTQQSMGGEDFAWFLESVPGALARLGVRAQGRRPFDLHQGTFDIDEAALPVGVRYTVALAHAALSKYA